MNTESKTNDQVKMRERDELSDIDYRPFNTLALVALLVSFLPLFGVLHPVMLGFGLLGILLALAALHMGSGREGKSLAGNGLARAALFVCFFSCSFALANRIAYRQYMAAHGIKYSHEFIQAIHNAEFGKVWGYAAEPPSRLPKDADLDKHFERTTANAGERYPPAMEMYMMKRHPPLPELLGDYLQGKTEYLGVGVIDRDVEGDEKVGIDYRYDPATPGMDDIVYRVILYRLKLPRPYNVQWRVDKLEVLSGAKKGRDLEFMDAKGALQGKGGSEDQ